MPVLQGRHYAGYVDTAETSEARNRQLRDTAMDLIFRPFGKEGSEPIRVEANIDDASRKVAAVFRASVPQDANCRGNPRFCDDCLATRSRPSACRGSWRQNPPVLLSLL
jgi:hypothetical protein